MLLSIVIIFIVGYLLIALEHPIRIDKAAVALLLGMVLWTLYTIGAPYIVLVLNEEALQQYVASSEGLKNLPLARQCIEYVLNVQIIEHLGDISEVLFFLMGAMTIVELIDVHGGFSIITNRITTRNKRRLLWLLGFITFFMSSILDNLTTSIVMVMLLRKLIEDQKERWIFASMIVIAANSGGAWSPIGDVTTIMLWVKGNVTTVSLLEHVFLPSIVSMVVPLLFATRMLKGELAPLEMVNAEDGYEKLVTNHEKNLILILGICGLVFVPIFKGFTHLPPFIGILLSLSLLWIFTEYMYNKKYNIEPQKQYRIPRVLKRIDTPTIFFFLGILMAVSVLQVTGLLGNAAQWLDVNVHNIYLINILLGILSSIVDNVPLVAAAIGMYPVTDASLVESGSYLSYFIQDGTFWQFLSYCVGVGGSILIIGSAAGVVVMGLERINFVWYFKHISLLALAGYLAGALVYICEVLIFNGAL